jgi:hypothetical protein
LIVWEKMRGNFAGASRAAVKSSGEKTSSMPNRMARNVLSCAVAAGLLVGCSQSAPQQQIVPSGPMSIDFSQRNNSGTITGEPASPDAILSTDPAASRLQDIGGFLLLYYRDHKLMPATLDDLANMPGGDSLNLAAPRSGREFSYVPTGLWSDSHPDKCIVAYDPDLRGSVRWCLLMTAPTTGAALTVNVLAVPESIFVKFKPNAP